MFRPLLRLSSGKFHKTCLYDRSCEITKRSSWTVSTGWTAVHYHYKELHRIIHTRHSTCRWSVHLVFGRSGSCPDGLYSSACFGILFYFIFSLLSFFLKHGKKAYATSMLSVWVRMFVNSSLSTFECLNQSLWHLVCVSWYSSRRRH
jgi:hypothetical protein